MDLVLELGSLCLQAVVLSVERIAVLSQSHVRLLMKRSPLSTPQQFELLSTLWCGRLNWNFAAF